VLNENSGPNGHLSWDDARLSDETAAAMRDLASTITEAPPLRLTAAPAGARAGRRARVSRRWTWGAPVLAAVTVVAVAVALVLVKDTPNGRVPAPTASASATAPVGPPLEAGGVPEYYVAWMQADRPYLLVQNTLTGKELAEVPSPPGIYLDGVYGGSADNRTWLVQGTHLSSRAGGTVWYILSINPDPRAKNPLQMGSIGIPVYQSPAGAVLSPDGTEAAVAVNGSTASSAATLRVYSLRTGALLHTWSAPGKFAAYSLNSADERTELALRWSPDGSHLGFVWNAKEIRAIPATAPDGSLQTGSTSLLAIGPNWTGIGSAFVCDAWQGWSLLQGGTGALCAGSDDESGVSRPLGAKPLKGSVGFMIMKHYGNGGSESGMIVAAPVKTTKAGPDDGAYLGWANADGSVVIGSTIAQGRTRFGIFRNGRFSPLPALPGAGALVPAGVLYGADVW
jgi:hypothetical protein